MFISIGSFVLVLGMLGYEDKNDFKSIVRKSLLVSYLLFQAFF